MKTIEELIQELNDLLPGHYICDREVDRDNFYSPATREIERFVFYKEKEETIAPFWIIGSNCPTDANDLLENCYGEYTPLHNIQFVK